ncbi:hypothetical protein ACJX0J_018121 [Zea mays]
MNFSSFSPIAEIASGAFRFPKRSSLAFFFPVGRFVGESSTFTTGLGVARLKACHYVQMHIAAMHYLTGLHALGPFHILSCLYKFQEVIKEQTSGDGNEPLKRKMKTWLDSHKTKKRNASPGDGELNAIFSFSFSLEKHFSLFSKIQNCGFSFTSLHFVIKYVFSLGTMSGAYNCRIFELSYTSFSFSLWDKVASSRLSEHELLCELFFTNLRAFFRIFYLIALFPNACLFFRMLSFFLSQIYLIALFPIVAFFFLSLFCEKCIPYITFVMTFFELFDCLQEPPGDLVEDGIAVAVGGYHGLWDRIQWHKVKPIAWTKRAERIMNGKIWAFKYVCSFILAETCNVWSRLGNFCVLNFEVALAHALVIH